MLSAEYRLHVQSSDKVFRPSSLHFSDEKH